MYEIDYICFFFQGSEIFTVNARDGDQGNPNPIHYSIMNGKNDPSTLRLHLVYSSACLSDTFTALIYHLSGSDGVFDINSTSGCITLTTYPSLLKNELYEIKVKVKKLFLGNYTHFF